MEGRLRRIYRDLQYGFIEVGKESYFFHKSNYTGEWGILCSEFETGDRIILEFEPTTTAKGLRAEDVRLSDI